MFGYLLGARLGGRRTALCCGLAGATALGVVSGRLYDRVDLDDSWTATADDRHTDVPVTVD